MRASGPRCACESCIYMSGRARLADAWLTAATCRWAAVYRANGGTLRSGRGGTGLKQGACAYVFALRIAARCRVTRCAIRRRKWKGVVCGELGSRILKVKRLEWDEA